MTPRRWTFTCRSTPAGGEGCGRHQHHAGRDAAEMVGRLHEAEHIRRNGATQHAIAQALQAPAAWPSFRDGWKAPAAVLDVGVPLPGCPECAAAQQPAERLAPRPVVRFYG